jgi:hypothetical protein
MEYDRKIKNTIGTVWEKRTSERAHNYHDLLRLARKLFAWNASDALRIIIDVCQARGALFPDRRGSFHEPLFFEGLSLNPGRRGRK